MKRIWILAALLILTLISGCAIGIKEKQTVIYAGFAKSPEELQGAIRIATNTKIPVTIIGETETLTEMDLGGMIAIREADLKYLVKEHNEKGD